MSTPSAQPAEFASVPRVAAVPLVRPTRQFAVPATIDTLFGREEEIAAVADALCSRAARLLVLTGPGGVGKTRLALASAAAAAPSFEDGALFVALAPIRDPALVLVTIAQAADIREAGPRPASIRLAEVLADRDLLLLLDNFEHLLPAGKAVSELLAACPNLTILMTSRGRPRLTGERDFPVQPLPLPRQQRAPPIGSRPHGSPTLDEAAATEPPDVDVDAIEESPAIRLFVDRARAIAPSFSLTDETAHAVAEICRRVDGLPLAIELAAAQTQLLPPKALLARLDQRLPLLAGGPRDQPERLQTMHRAIAWSFDLLKAEDQTAFLCLATFVGGFGLDAAQEVCGAALPVVTGLIDQSLLQTLPSDNEPRCMMLETIREFGLDALTATDLEPNARDRHAGWYVDLAARLEPDLFGGRDQVPTLRRLEQELPNLRSAYHWLCETGRHEDALRLPAALFRFFFICGHSSEGRAWLEDALANAPSVAPALRARGLLGLAMVAMQLHDHERAAAAIAEALFLIDPERDAKEFSRAGTAQALFAYLHGNYATAAAFAAAAEATAKEIGSRWDAYIARFLRAKATLYSGDLESAEGIIRDLIASAQGEEVYILSSARHDAGILCALRDDHHGALVHFTQALHAFQKLGELWNAAASLEGAAASTGALGHATRAAFLFGAADALRKHLAAPVLLPDRPAYERGLAAARSALGEDAFAAAWAEGHASSLDAAIVVLEAVAATTAESRPPREAVSRRHASLSPREREVLALLVAGQSDPQIGATLNISPRTVESHVAAILAKLAQPSRTAAVAHAVRYDLV